MTKIIIIFISIFYSYLFIFNAVVFADQDWYLNNINIHKLRKDNAPTKFSPIYGFDSILVRFK